MATEESNEKVEPVSAAYLESEYETAPATVLAQGYYEQKKLALSRRDNEDALRLGTRCRLLGLLAFELMCRYKGVPDREAEFAAELDWLSVFRAAVNGDHVTPPQEQFTDELLEGFLDESNVIAREL